MRIGCGRGRMTCVRLRISQRIARLDEAELAQTRVHFTFQPQPSSPSSPSLSLPACAFQPWPALRSARGPTLTDYYLLLIRFQSTENGAVDVVMLNRQSLHQQPRLRSVNIDAMWIGMFP